MKINVKQIYDMEVKPEMTLDDVRNIITGVHIFYKEDDCFLTNKGNKLYIRRVIR